MNPDEYQRAVSKLPPKVRLWIYLGLVFVAAMLAAAAAYFVAISEPVPNVIRGLLAAVGVITIGPLSVAASNVPKKDTPPADDMPPPDDEPIAEYDADEIPANAEPEG